MADFNLPEDEAVLYVLGELKGARLGDFEARLSESAELRTLVRQLEEGAVVLSQSSPPRRPPPDTWARIEKALRHGGEQKIGVWDGWAARWRSGWAAAAIAVAGWMLYAIFVNRPGGSRAEQSVPPEPAMVHSSGVENSAAHPAVAEVSNARSRLLQARTEEAGRLRHEVSELEKETTQLSQLLVQQRALLGESNRIKFYHLTPVSSGADADAARLSPALQRAVYLSIGRQLGWLPAQSAAPAEKNESRQLSDNLGEVDFVDLRPTNSNVANQPAAPPPAESEATNTFAAAIPAFVSGDSLVVAVDPTVVPTNSYLTFGVTGDDGATTGGTIRFENNPTVVTIPMSASVSFASGFVLSVSSSSASGQTNLTQYFTAPSH